MSNPSGTGSDTSRQEDRRGAEAQAYRPEVDSDPATEVIEIPADLVRSASSESIGDERRYTAPGFDAGCTQIIDRVPDPETDLLATDLLATDLLETDLLETDFLATAPTQAFASSPRIRAAAPQAIPPRSAQRPSWLLPILLLVAALAAAAIVGLVLLKRSQSAKAAREAAVRSTIQTFDTAIRDGDLTALRNITCGQTRQTYVDYDDKTWAEAYARVSAAKQYPVVASVDDIVVNGDHAEANVTSYMAFDPATKSTRSFDLQFSDDRWKVCQSA